jgi:integrase
LPPEPGDQGVALGRGRVAGDEAALDAVLALKRLDNVAAVLNPTGEQAARRVLSNLLAEAEKVKAGILTPEESRAARHVARPIEEHFDAYIEFLRAKIIRGRRVAPSHCYDVRTRLGRLAEECDLKRLGDITRQRITRWLNREIDSGVKAARTIQKYRSTLMAFCKWAVRENRLAHNPLVELPGVPMGEQRRWRRALEVEELAALLDAAAKRPLNEALLIRRGSRKGQLGAKVRKSERERLIRLGRERSLIYKTLVYTGLRKNELTTLTIGNVHLDAPQPYVEVAAKNAKSGRSARIPLRADLVQDLREHLDDKLAQYRLQTLKDGRLEVPMALPGSVRLFRVPLDLVKIFDRDLIAAGVAREVIDPKTGKRGIDKTDADGRTLDVHSLRHTFATLLSKSGVIPRTAQELMRHSDIRLTMNVYTHLQLADTAGAVEALPGLTSPRLDRAAACAATG